MAHFAELSDDNKVIRVIVVANAELMQDGIESESKGVAFLSRLYGDGRWKQTSYNRRKRGNFAGVGFLYDEVRDAFVPPKPFGSWTLDDSTLRWSPPVPRPAGNSHKWDETAQEWKPCDTP
jgi:hypothetical protein